MIELSVVELFYMKYVPIFSLKLFLFLYRLSLFLQFKSSSQFESSSHYKFCWNKTLYYCIFPSTFDMLEIFINMIIKYKVLRPPAEASARRGSVGTNRLICRAKKCLQGTQSVSFISSLLNPSLAREVARLAGWCLETD